MTASSSNHSAKESSITVAVRVRPFTSAESSKLIVQKHDRQILGDGAFSSNNQSRGLGNGSGSGGGRFGPKGIRKIVDVVDERMLIFDPADENPIQKMQQSLFPKSTSRIREHRFTFDRLFDEGASQEEVYNNTTKPLLDSVLDGYNATVFAYGATGCGKTHTISGTPDKPGIIYSTTQELFQRIETLKDTKSIEVSLSYLEIYNETIRDLLNPETESKLLTIREDANHRISVRNLSSHRLTTVDEIVDLIVEGNANRTVNSTEANATSSRSHAVLQVNIDQKDRTGGVNEEHFFATLSIIDLAGSERASATKNKGQRLHEGANINRSLLALGNCINALCDPRRKNHVPYRDSKLTRLLKFSLGGNCKTVMIVCISPSSQHYDETLNTLKYANRAKEIKTKVIRNTHNLDRHVGSYLKMITEQKQEIEELRSREERVVEQRLKAFQKKSEKCSLTLIESVDRIKNNLLKYDIEKFKKSRLLVKKRILILQRLEVNLFLKSFYTNYGSRFDDIPRDLIDVKELVKKVHDKLDQEIEQINQLCNKENELDRILSSSTKLTLQKLKDLDGWTDYDTLIFNSLVEGLKKEVDAEVLSRSNILWDSIISKNGGEVSSSFNFLSNSFFKIFKKLTFINTSGDIDVIRDENLSLINGMLNDVYEVLNNLGFEHIDKFLKFDVFDKVSGEKRLSSPKRVSLSPHKSLRNNHSFKVKSPIKRKVSHKIKKVRWDLPVNTSVAHNHEEDEDDDGAEDEDDEDEVNQQESEDDDDDDEENGDAVEGVSGDNTAAITRHVNLIDGESNARQDTTMNESFTDSPVFSSKFTFTQLPVFKNKFVNYLSPRKFNFNSTGAKTESGVSDNINNQPEEEKEAVENMVQKANNDPILRSKFNNPKRTLTGLTLRPAADSDISKLSIDTSILDKENYLKDLDEPPSPNQHQHSLLGDLSLTKSNGIHRLDLSPPVRLGQSTSPSETDAFHFDSSPSHYDKFNFEANVSGDIQMSDVSND